MKTRVTVNIDISHISNNWEKTFEVCLPMPKTYTVKEVADILGFSTNSIYTFLKENRIKGIRIGQGGYRISEQELARVLHLSKKSTEDSDLAHGSPSGLVPQGDVLCPNLFDWFAGLAAIIAGIGLFLFNSSLVRPEAAGFFHVAFAVRVVLIAAGGGVLASAVVVQAYGWHKIFHAILGTLGLINGVMLIRGGDVDGAILYAAMGFLLWLGLIFHPKGIVWLGIYLTLLAVFFPVWIFSALESPEVITAAWSIGISAAWFGWGVVGAGVGYVVLFWLGFARRPAALVASSVLAGLLCLGGAVWYGQIQYWSRAFFLIVLGFFAGLMPCWHFFCDGAPKRQRLLLHGLFAAAGVTLIAAIFVVYMLQRNLWARSAAEFLNRISTAQTLLTSTVEAAQSAAVLTAANTDVTIALQKKDLATLISASKLLYESNSAIRRVVFLSASGQGVSLYPYGTFDLANYAFREYFVKARDTRAPYISNVFQSAVDDVGRYVAVVAVPVLTPKGAFAGVLAVSIDLDKLGFKLRQLTMESRGEYFIIVDQEKTILSHPDKARIGTKLPDHDVVFTTPSDQTGITGGVLPDGTLGLIAYGPVDRLGWTVTLRMPVMQVYAFTPHAGIWVFGTVAVVLVATMWFASLLKVRWSGQSGGGP